MLGPTETKPVSNSRHKLVVGLPYYSLSHSLNTHSTILTNTFTEQNTKTNQETSERRATNDQLSGLNGTEAQAGDIRSHGGRSKQLTRR